MTQSLMMVAGERSGDLYGGELASALRRRIAGLQIFGCGGEAMRRAGVETPVDAHEVSLVGTTEILRGFPRVYRAFHKLVDEVDHRRPSLAVLIDFPSFNLRMAKSLKKRNVTVVYFVSPQLWAWKKWRIREVRARVDKMLCIFDFEEALYQKAGVPVEYVGHPLVDLARPRLSRQEFFAKAGLDPGTPTVALLPGSRPIEVSYNLPPMLDAASRLALYRKLQFVVGVAPALDAAWIESLITRGYVGRCSLRALLDVTQDTLEHSDVAAIASGTATIEATLRERPMVVVYRVSTFSWVFGKIMVDVPFYSMVNLLAKKPVVPELMQGEFTGQNLAARLEFLLDRPEARQEMIRELRALKPRLGPGGAIERAADAIVGLFQRSETTPPVG